MSVLVVLEPRGGNWNGVSFEALAAAQKLAQAAGGPVYAAIPGANLEELARQAAAYELEKVFALEHQLLGAYTAEAYAMAFEQLIKAVQPQAVVFPHTYQVRDYAPKLAARFSTALVSDVVDLKTDSAAPVFVRQIFQGKLNADVHASRGIPFFSVQAGAFRASQPRPQGSGMAAIEQFAVEIDAAQICSRPEEPFRETQRAVDLSNAERIVAAGRGIQKKENLRIVEALAQAFGAELAASRPICDNGWLPMERQVGSSGQTVAPKLYVAVGISGAIQHLVGMKGSKTIVAINKDETAPIFETADYGIAGDLFEVAPALIEELQKIKA
ncbi:MAG: electron transfer flavoprotein subunit alpha/FixB family protein [Bryobacteraceae bacterium]